MIAAARLPARRLPANSQFDLPMAIGLMWFSTHVWTPRFAKRSIRDGSKVKIAAMYPDFESGTCLLSLMECARQDLISCPCS